MSVSAGPSRLRGRAAGSEATAPAASPDLARRWHPLGMDSLVTDRHPPSRSSRSHIRIPPRHRARLVPTPARPLRSPVLGRSRRPGPRGSWALSGRRPGPGTRWEAPRGVPGELMGDCMRLGAAAGAMALEAGPELSARVAFRSAFGAQGVRLPGGSGCREHQGPAAGRERARLAQMQRRRRRVSPARRSRTLLRAPPRPGAGKQALGERGAGSIL